MGRCSAAGVLRGGDAMRTSLSLAAGCADAVEDTVAPLRISCPEGLYETSSNEVGAG